MTTPPVTHEAIQIELPAYAAGRLTGELRVQVAAHLDTCDTCSDLVATLQGLGQTIGQSSEALFGDHPAPSALRDFALGVTGAAEIRSHTEVCVSCALEVQEWRRVPRQARPRVSSAGWRVGLAAAAGVVIGLALAMIMPRAPAAPPAIGPQLILLPAQRSDTNAGTYHLLPGQRAVVVASPVVIPRDARDADLYRFELGPAGGSVTWSQELTAAAIREHLEKTEMVTLLVPAAALPPGRHELRLISVARPQSPVYRKVVEIQAADPGAP